jgi:bifunctional non-homologous end joining protein LigD
VLGLYNERGQLIHVGQAGTGFSQATLKGIWQILKPLETKRSPFYGPVEAGNAHGIKPQRVAEIKFTEWTHGTADGGMKLRAPVFMGLREDKDPKQCTLADQIPTLKTER